MLFLSYCMHSCFYHCLKHFCILMQFLDIFIILQCTFLPLIKVLIHYLHFEVIVLICCTVVYCIIFLKTNLFTFLYECSACAPACRKRASDLVVDGHEPACRCWELNSGPLKGQSVLLTTEPSLQPLLNNILI